MLERFIPPIPVGETAVSDFGAFQAAVAGPVQMLEDECELTDRQLLLALLAEVQFLRQEVADLLPSPVLPPSIRKD